MTNRTAPRPRTPTAQDFRASLTLAWQDFRAATATDMAFASVFVICGLLMAAITYVTGTTFWLVLAVLGFPLVGALAALGFYETSRRREADQPVSLSAVQSVVWSARSGQLPWLAVMIVILFLFWFFLGHMLFALFLGLSPMTNVSSSLQVFFTPEGLSMLGLGTIVGAVFALVTFAASVLGMPMLLDRDIDFMTALITSMGAVRDGFLLYAAWGVFIALVTLLAMLPAFLGLFIAMPVLGHASWHLYKRVTTTA